MLPVFAVSVLQVVPLSVDLSIMYPLMGEPPLLLGAVQLRLICDAEIAVALTPVGGDGGSAGVVVKAVFEGGLVPTVLIAETL